MTTTDEEPALTIDRRYRALAPQKTSIVSARWAPVRSIAFALVTCAFVVFSYAGRRRDAHLMALAVAVLALGGVVYEVAPRRRIELDRDDLLITHSGLTKMRNLKISRHDIESAFSTRVGFTNDYDIGLEIAGQPPLYLCTLYEKVEGEIDAWMELLTSEPMDVNEIAAKRFGRPM